jgi:hypothetical protein
MAWTTPGTATAGEVLTAAFWNAQVRDNVEAIRQAQINVQQDVKLDTFETTSTSFVDITGLSVSITPTATTSKILLMAHVNVGVTYPSSVSQAAHLRFAGGNSGTYIGDAGGASQERSAMSLTSGASFIPADATIPMTMIYLDSPATTSPIAYKVQIRFAGASVSTVRVNYSKNDSNNVVNPRTACSITAIEIPV